MNALSICNLQNPLNGVFFLVYDDVVCAVSLGKRSFLLSGGGTDDSGATMFGELAEEKTQTAGDSMDEYDITLLNVVCFLHKGSSSDTLDESGNSGKGRDGVGNRIDGVP